MNTGKITIGLTYTGSEAKHNNYVNWIKGADNIEVITLSADLNNLERVQQTDAVILSGGIDIHPGQYKNNHTTYPNAPQEFNEARDVFEIAVFRLAMQLALPVLAICRGMQLVNCSMGGDLVQDLGEKNEVHRLTDTGKKHDVHIQPGTLLHHITSKEKDIADSAHHQCIDRLGTDLLINAWSADDIAEGIEWADKAGKPFFLGVQWHPERMHLLGIQASSLSENIRQHFVSAITKEQQ